MNKKILALSLIFGILFLSACQNSESLSGSSPSSGVQQSSASEIPSAPQDIYRYDNIPAFSFPNIVPQKITYYNVMLGETTVILDSERIEQVTEILSEVEINDAPTKKENEAELHQVIGFYQNVDDEEPAYSLYFLVDSLYIETNGISSDVYPTLNWINKGTDDESKVNVKFRKLIDSWARPSFPSSPHSSLN